MPHDFNFCWEHIGDCIYMLVSRCCAKPMVASLDELPPCYWLHLFLWGTCFNLQVPCYCKKWHVCLWPSLNTFHFSPIYTFWKLADAYIQMVIVPLVAVTKLPK